MLLVAGMCTQDCTCISCTVVFGQQLAALFHIWTELSTKADDHLDQVVYDIEACTSALSQLNVFLEQDRTSQTQTFTPAGHQEIETLSIKCNLIFKAVIILAQKAVERKLSDSSSDSDSDSDDDDRKVVKWSTGIRKSSRKERMEDERAKQHEKVEENSELLVGPVPSLTSPITLGLIGKLSGKWDWLSNRVTRCQIQLRWVRKSLLLQLQMGRLACLANQYVLSISPQYPSYSILLWVTNSSLCHRGSTDENGSFESQLVVRFSVNSLRESQLKCVQYRARKQRIAEKRVQRRLEAQKEEDTASIYSSSSLTTVRTVVGEEPPLVKDSDAKVVPPILPPPPTVCLNALPNSIHPTGAPEAPVTVKVSTGEAEKDKISSRLSTSLNDLNLKVSEAMSEWTHKIFGKEDEFSKDWESQKLEAWVYRTDAPYFDPIKVPFGHQRLQYGLKRITSKKDNKLAMTTFARYVDEGPRMQVYVHFHL